MRLAITRPLDDAKRQAAQLKALGHDPYVYPLLDVVYPHLTPLNLTSVQGMIATSRNALRGLARNGSFELARRLPVYCVGEGTSELAGEIGFPLIITGRGAAKDLVPLIEDEAKPEAGALLYLTGQHLAYDLEAPLKASGFEIPRIIIYEAQIVDPALRADFAENLRTGLDGVILMSARTASAFSAFVTNFQLMEEVRGITCYCYSEAIAKSLGEIDGLTIAVSSRPTEAEFINLIGPAPFRSESLVNLQRALGNH